MKLQKKSTQDRASKLREQKYIASGDRLETQDRIQPNIKRQVSSNQENEVDYVKWFLSAFEDYQRGKASLPTPPFKLNSHVKIVNNLFYKSIFKMIKKGNLSSITLESIQEIYNLVETEK